MIRQRRVESLLRQAVQLTQGWLTSKLVVHSTEEPPISVTLPAKQNWCLWHSISTERHVRDPVQR